MGIRASSVEEAVVREDYAIEEQAPSDSPDRGRGSGPATDGASAAGDSSIPQPGRTRQGGGSSTPEACSSPSDRQEPARRSEPGRSRRVTAPRSLAFSVHC